jgi:hypothetical protein
MSLRLFAAVAFAVITAYGQPLTIDPGAPPGGREGFPYLARLEANGGNRPYRWSIISGELPPGIAWTGIGILGGLPSRPGTFTFRVEVRDRNNDRAQANLQITIEPRSLSITSGSSLPEATAGAFYSYTLSASGGSPPYVWSVTGGSLPAGLLLAPAGVVAGTPAGPNASGFTVQVRDSRDATASATLALTVRAAPLRIVTGTLPRATVGIGYSQMLNGTGGTPPYVWSENGGALPPGLSLSAAGAISGTPTTVGVFSFSVRLSDGRETDTRELSIRVDPAPLTISTTALPNGAVNAAYSAILAAGGGAPPYAWSVASGSLPAGLSLATNGAISGTPAAAGSSTFTVRVTDGSSQNATRLLSITVAPATLSSPTTTLADGMVGVAYWTTLTANGGAPPYSWSVTSGILPAGLSLAANGAITGTPAAAGISTFTVRVTDSASQLATSSLSITIAPAALSITTASLPDGTIGQAYSATLTAGGGTAPYTWNMVSGSLPAGLSLSANGAITGTPAAEGQ